MNVIYKIIRMKYTSLFFFIVLNYFPVVAQQQIPDFQTTIYVEDMNGYIDSVIIGYDATKVAWQLDSNFGEIDISNVLWDSIFEVRLIADYYNQPIDYQLKKRIVSNDCDSTITHLYRGALYIFAVKTQTEGQPFTIRWNPSDFTNYCRSGSFIFEELFFTQLPWGTFDQFWMTNNGDSASLYWDKTFFPFEVVDEAGDTSWVNTFILVIGNGYPLNTSAIQQQTKVFPNPMSNHFTIQLPDNYQSKKVSIVNMMGKVVYESFEKTNTLFILSENWSKGIYFYQIQLDNNIVINGKILKN